VGTVFCAAAIRRLKNTLGLVRAFEVVQQTCSSARLRLAGADSEPDYAREVRAFTSNAGISDKVSFLGPLGAAQVQEELAQASVFALVSLQENAPMGIAEAMAAGAPVVTSDRCGMPYMVRSGETGLLVEPANTEAVSRALLKLLNDDVVRHEMGRKARQVALERFHPDRVAERTMAVYRRAIQDFQGRCPAN
jgi:glycosyltransferase involved in cell wall biosynthesis